MNLETAVVMVVECQWGLLHEWVFAHDLREIGLKREHFSQRVEQILKKELFVRYLM